MKKIYLLFAALVLSFTAQAKVINAVPEGDIAYYLGKAESGDIIELADGVYDEKAILTFSVNGLVVKAAEGANPVIQTVGKWMAMNVEAATTFEGIVFDAEAGTDGDNQYGFNISANATFNNCKFQDYTKYAVTLLAGTTTFDNCVFDGAGVTPSAIVIDGTIAECSIENSEFKNYKDYIISVEDNTTIATLTIDQCVFDGAVESVNTTKAALFTEGIVSTSNIQDSEFKNFAECVATVDKWYGGRYDALTINNCLIHDCTQSAIYLPDAIDTNEKQTCSDFKLTNSTIYNIGNDGSFGTIDIQDNTNIASEQQVLVDHVTIYNFLNSGWHGAIKVEESANAVVSNCIVMNTVQEWANPYKLFTGAQIKNSLYYNTEYADNGATTTNLVEADPMFVDAANADFMLYAESPAVGAGTDGSNLGDPRWGVKPGLQPGSGKLKAAVNAAQAGATIELGDGIYEEPSSIDFNKEGLTIKAAEGTNPVVKASSYLKHNATTTFIGITFDGQDVAEYTTYSYKTDTEKDLTFINCEFKNYTKSCVTIGDGGANVRNLLVDGCSFDGGSKTPAAIKSSGIISACDIKDSEIKGYTEYGFVANSSSAHTDELSVDNTIIHDCGYSAIYVTAAANGKDKQSCSSFELTNSTIYNVGNNTKDHGAVDIRDNANIASAQQVLVDHVTLYNFNTKDWYGGFMIYQSANATISNCIVSNPADLSGKNGYHVYGNAVVTNSLYNNCNITSGAQQTANIKADPLFVDAANANFMLSANSPAIGKGTDGSNLGDPRWGVSASLKGKVINIEPGQQTLAAAVGYSVSPGDTIVLADGTYEEPYSFNFDVEGLVVMAAEGAKPEIILTDAGGNANLKLDNSTTFDGITFSGSNISKYLIITNGTDASKFIFNNCEFKNYLNYAISDPWTDNYDNGRHVDSILINNCLFHDGGAAINLSKYGPEGKHTCDYFEMKNSTIYNISNTGNAAILVSSNNESTGAQNKVVLDHITIYNYANASYGAIAIRKSSDLQITNSIIANPTSGLYAFYIYGGTINNTLYYNATYDSDANYTACITEDPLFVDAANANFMLSANSPAVGAGTDGSNLGDPRWDVAMLELGDINNKEAIAKYDGQTMDVKVNRTLKANDGWYTICVPFDLSQAQLNKIGKAYVLNTDPTTATYDESTGSLTIQLVPVTNGLEARMPYLILPSKDIESFVAEDVTIDYANGHEGWQAISGISFYSQTEQTGRKMDFEMRSVLYGGDKTNGWYWIGNGGYLYNDEVDKLGLRAYCVMRMEGGSGMPPRVRVVAKDNEATGLDNTQLPMTNIQKAIENGQLIIIRGGEKYNVQGQKL